VFLVSFVGILEEFTQEMMPGCAFGIPWDLCVNLFSSAKAENTQK
jgi:hypothetical protein